MSRLIPVLVIAALGLTAAVVVRSMDWPLMHDAPLMHYIAWRISEGAVPYRDLFDMNMPGVYLIHLAILKGLGGGDLAWRWFDLGWLVATCAAIAAYGRRLGGAWAGLAAAVLFALYHLAASASDMGQRDFLLVVFLVLGAYGVATSHERPGRWGPLALGGLAVGAGLTIKPFAVLYALALTAVVLWSGRGPEKARRLLIWSTAAALPLVAVFGWLAAIGGLGPFLELLLGYVRPFYGSLGAQSASSQLVALLAAHAASIDRTMGRGGFPPVWGWPAVIAWLVGAIVALALALREKLDVNRGLLLVGLAYGLLHYVLQGKGWAYHAYPLVAVATLATACLIAPARGRARLALGLAVWLGATGYFGLRAVLQPDHPWVLSKVALVDDLEAQLRRVVPPGGRVQVMDTTGGGIHALYRLRVAQPTPFIYDFHFFHDTDTPTIQALRARFVGDMERDRPAAIVVFRVSWLRSGYDRLGEIPGLAVLLDRHYVLGHEAPGAYRLYVEKSHP